MAFKLFCLEKIIKSTEATVYPGEKDVGFNGILNKLSH